MKIRQGFVSNSSSSSFTVRFKNNSWTKNDKSKLATEDDIKKLAEYGFQLSLTDNPFDVHSNNFKDLGDNNVSFVTSLKYSVTVNQSIILTFLINNEIPFKASIHYDNAFYQYKRGDDKILVARNFGQVLAMYGADKESVENEKDSSPISYQPVDWYKKDGDELPYSDTYNGDNKLDAEYVIKIKNTPYGEDIKNED